MNNFTHIYCDNCRAITESVFDSILIEDVSGKFAGGDICCAACHFVIATLYKLSTTGVNTND